MRLEIVSRTDLGLYEYLISLEYSFPFDREMNLVKLKKIFIWKNANLFKIGNMNCFH